MLLESKSPKSSAPPWPETKSGGARVNLLVTDIDQAGGNELAVALWIELLSPKRQEYILVDGCEAVKERPHQAVSLTPENGTKRNVDEEAGNRSFGPWSLYRALVSLTSGGMSPVPALVGPSGLLSPLVPMPLLP